MSTNAIIPIHRIEILFKSGNSKEYFCIQSEFGDHPEYFEITIPLVPPFRILTADITGIAFEKHHFL